MAKVMKYMDIGIPNWQRTMHLEVSVDEKTQKLAFTGVDSNGKPYDLFKKVSVSNLTTLVKDKQPQHFPKIGSMKQPFKCEWPGKSASKYIDVSLTFQGHYNENNL